MLPDKTLDLPFREPAERREKKKSCPFCDTSASVTLTCFLGASDRSVGRPVYVRVRVSVVTEWGRIFFSYLMFFLMQQLSGNKRTRLTGASLHRSQMFTYTPVILSYSDHLGLIQGRSINSSTPQTTTAPLLLAELQLNAPL